MSLSAILFLIIFFTGTALCLFKSPFYGVLLYELNYFFDPPVRWWYGELPDFRWAYLVSMVMMVGFFIRYRSFSDNRLSDITPYKWLAILTVIIVFSYFWCFNFVSHHDLTIRYIKYIVVYFLFFKIINTEKELDAAFAVYIIGVFYISWVAWTTGRGGGARLEGIGASDGIEVNSTAALVVTAVPLLMYSVLFIKTKWGKGLALVASAFVLNALILLNSRGAFLGIVASTLWFSFTIFREKGIKKEKWRLCLGLLGGALLFLYLSDAVFWERMSTLKNTDAETGGAHRTLYWLKTFDMLKDHPLGLGGDGYMWASPLYLPAEWLTGGMRAVHSTWFEVLSSFGYHGLFVFLGFIISTFLLSHRVKKYLKDQGQQFRFLQITALESSFIAFLVSSTFINRFYSEPMYMIPTLIAVYANVYVIKHQGGNA